jgi:hypothetical protein
MFAYEICKLLNTSDHTFNKGFWHTTTNHSLALTPNGVTTNLNSLSFTCDDATYTLNVDGKETQGAFASDDTTYEAYLILKDVNYKK